MFKARFTRPDYIPAMMTMADRTGGNILVQVKPGQEIEFMDAIALSSYIGAVNAFYPGLVEAAQVPPTEGPWHAMCNSEKVWGIYGPNSECIAMTDNTEGLTKEEVEANAHVLAAAHSMYSSLEAILSEVRYTVDPRVGQPVRTRTANDIERWAREALKRVEDKL